MYLALLLAPALLNQAAAPVSLQRTFTLGQKSKYHVEARIENEIRLPAEGLQTYLPQVTLLRYDFFTRVTKVEAGNAIMRYYRPYIIETDDTGQTDGPVTQKVILDMMADLTVSPINAILDVKDLSGDKKPVIKQIPTPDTFAVPLAARKQKEASGILGGFFEQLQQVAVFIGSLQSGIDFKPDFSLVPTAVGDTWKRTVGYEPQAMNGGKGKTAVVRLDLTYTYKGEAKYNDKPVLEIDGHIHLDSDVANYFKDQFKATAEQTHIKSLPLTLDEDLVFYVDPKTRQTLYALVTSTGGYDVISTDSSSAVLNNKIKGKCEMTLVSNTP